MTWLKRLFKATADDLPTVATKPRLADLMAEVRTQDEMSSALVRPASWGPLQLPNEVVERIREAIFVDQVHAAAERKDGEAAVWLAMDFAWGRAAGLTG